MVLPDLSGLTFQEWVRFIFDHPVERIPWYHGDQANYDITDERRILKYLTQLFKNPCFLLEQFSEVQLEQGFWFLLGPKGVMGVLWNSDSPFTQRKECIDSMYDLFQLLFWDHPLPTISFMWWDFLTEQYDLNDGRSQNDDDALVQEEMFQVLLKLLDTLNPVQAKSALRGLGYLKHPKSNEAIDQYLANHSEISNDLKSYALECKKRMDGMILPSLEKSI